MTITTTKLDDNDGTMLRDSATRFAVKRVWQLIIATLITTYRNDSSEKSLKVGLKDLVCTRSEHIFLLLPNILL